MTRWLGLQQINLQGGLMKNKFKSSLFIFSVLIGVLYFQSGIAKEPALKTYTNPRFAYSVSYEPNLFLPQGESANGDGQEFLSTDGKATLKVYGGLNSLSETLEQRYKKEMQFEPGSAKKEITYHRLKKNFFVISGIENGRTFYKKTFLVGDVFKTIVLEYPTQSRSTYDPVTEKIVRSFQPHSEP